jgi:hypothetical protein
MYKNDTVTVSSEIQRCRLNRKRLSIENVALHCHLTIGEDTVALRIMF